VSITKPQGCTKLKDSEEQKALRHCTTFPLLTFLPIMLKSTIARHISFYPTPTSTQIKMSLVQSKYSWCIMKEKFALGLGRPCRGGCSLLLPPGLPAGLRWGTAFSNATNMHVATLGEQEGKIQATAAFLSFQSWERSQCHNKSGPSSQRNSSFFFSPRKFD